jgi:hypothetical protein
MDFTSVVSCVITLCIGLLQSDNVMKAIEALPKAFGLEDSVTAWFVSFVVVVSAGAAIVLALLWIVRKCVARLSFFRRRKLHQIEKMCARVNTYLDRMAREFEKEGEFDEDALNQLRSLTDDCQRFIHQILKHRAFLSSDRFAQRVCALRDAVREHTDAEIHAPLHQAAFASRDVTISQLARSYAGIGCVNRLLTQMDLEAARHPVRGL